LAGFDRHVAVDWSARAKPAPERPSKDAIWIAWDDEALYCRTRGESEGALAALMTGRRRVLAGFDFALAFPAWAMRRLCGWRKAWGSIEKLESRGLDRFEIAAELNRRLGLEAFWGGKLSAKKPAGAYEWEERRVCEREERGVQSAFKLWGAGSVGSQTLTGIPVLERLRRRFGAAVWPFEDVDGARVVFAEVWPRLAKEGRGAVLDERQARGLVRWMAKQPLAVPAAWRALAREEGWILGVPFDHEPPQISKRRGVGAAAGRTARDIA
jgi:molybdopterin molybdotransferase